MVPHYPSTLRKWPRELSTVKEVWSVLGVLGYQCPFIPHYADIAQSFTALTKQNHPFLWMPECCITLDTLIKAVTEGPTLAQPRLTLLSPGGCLCIFHRSYLDPNR